MHLRDTIKMSFTGLSSHKSRSALTILGIVIGITAIILVMALGKSAADLILGEVQGLGPNNIFIIPGQQPKGISGFGGTLLNDSLKQKDLEDLMKKENVPDAVRVVPFVFGPVTISFENQSYAGMSLGGTPDIFSIYNLGVREGSFFTVEHDASRSSVVLLGQKIVDKLFGESDPIGQNVKIKNKNFRVIGILEPKGQSPFVNFDEAAIMPYTSLQQYVLGIRYIQRIVVQTKDLNDIPGVIKDVTLVLRTNHNISDPADDDFFIQTQADLVNTLGSITTALTVFLSSVAAISLVVGGVGIMNIMFVSVTERTREIGLRKALGATNKNILVQFLVEAVMLTVTGGIIGIALGTGLSFLVVLALKQFVGVNFAFAFPLSGAILGLVVSSSIGFIFGIFPARKASLKSPVEALRYE